MENGIRKICDKMDDIGSILELQERLMEYGVNTTSLHFFVGTSSDMPGSFGITQCENDFLVYKVEDDSTLTEYYRGKDEKYATKLAIQRLVELDNTHQSHVNLSKNNIVSLFDSYPDEKDDRAMIKACVVPIRVGLSILAVVIIAILAGAIMNHAHNPGVATSEPVIQAEQEVQEVQEFVMTEPEEQVQIEYKEEEPFVDGVKIENPADGVLYWLVRDMIAEISY